MVHDFDHNKLVEKLGNVFNKGWEEALKCTVRCCYCHQIKTIAENDCVRWYALKHGSDEICYLVSAREGNGNDVEIEGADLRVGMF